MDKLDTSGKAFVQHWTWAADKGLMNPNTAKALKAAAAQVLLVLDDWETVDIKTLNVEQTFKRFQNKRAKDFTPNSLDTYRSRFGKAVNLFLEYEKDPTSWHVPSQAPRKEKKTSEAPESPQSQAPKQPQVQAQSVRPPSQPGFVEYPFPLRDGKIAQLRLPIDLKKSDVARLTAFLSSLAIEQEVVA